MRTYLTSLLLFAVAITSSARTAANGGFSVVAYGAKGDGVADDTPAIIAATEAAAANGGGIVFVPPGVYKKTKPILLGNASNKPSVELHLDPGASIVDYTTGGLDGFRLFDGSGITCIHGISTFKSEYKGCTIRVAATAHMSSLVTNGSKDGTQQGWFISGVHFLGSPSASVGAMLDFTGGSVGTYMRDITVDNFSNIGIRLLASGSVITSDLDFENVASAGYPGSVHARPWVFSSPPGTTGGISRIYCYRCQAENAGTEESLFEISSNGRGSEGVYDIAIYGLSLESGEHPKADGLVITDAANVHVFGLFSSDGGRDLVKIVETSPGRVYGVSLFAIDTINWTNVLNDISSEVVVPTYLGIGYLDYYQHGSQIYGSVALYNNGTARHSDFERATFDWSKNTFRIFTSSHGNGLSRNLLIGTAGNATAGIMTDSKLRWFFDSIGTFQSEEDNKLDIGKSGSGRPRHIYVGTSLRTGSARNTDQAGQLPLSSGSATYRFKGNYTSPPICVATDINADNPVRIETMSDSLTVTGHGNDVVNYICVGRN